MIIGNPYTFSIIIDIVDEWNIDKSFNNGLLFIGVNGVLIPDKILFRKKMGFSIPNEFIGNKKSTQEEILKTVWNLL